LQSSVIEKYFNDSLTGSTIKNLGLGAIRNAPIPLPPTIAEQAAIAETLSNMDAEIEVLNTKLQKLRSIKQGMMQELLTGKTRLIKQTA
jgi:type I restriction enzyme S subunit